MVRDRAILTIFVTHRVYEKFNDNFSQKLFPPFLPSILNFYVKCKNAVISETLQDRAISKKFWNRRVYVESVGDFWQNLFLAVILNFCVIHKNAFISKTVRDRAGSTKVFDPHGISRVY